jgi:hypothetical protein
VRLEGLGKLKKSTSSGTRTADLPACSIVPQSTTLSSSSSSNNSGSPNGSSWIIDGLAACHLFTERTRTGGTKKQRRKNTHRHTHTKKIVLSDW